MANKRIGGNNQQIMVKQLLVDTSNMRSHRTVIIASMIAKRGGIVMLMMCVLVP